MESARQEDGGRSLRRAGTGERFLRLAPLSGPLFALAIVFPEAILGGGVFYDRDISAYWLPHVATLVRIVSQGSWPLWNPYEGFGLPLLGDPSLQLAYPPTWLNFVLRPGTVYKVLLLGHAMLAGAGGVALARRWGMSRLAASVAGAAWCVSGPLLSAGSLHQHICGAAWIAWVLVALESALEAPGRRAAAGLGLAAAAQALTGSADMCLLTALAGIGRVAFWLATAVRGASWRAAAATVAAAIVLAFSVGAVQWVPSAALLGSVARGRLAPAEILYWSIHPLSAVDLLVPRFFADLPLSPALRGMLFEGREPFLVSLYVGLSSLPLVLLSGPLRGGRPAYAATMAAGFGLAALGRHVFLLPALLTTPPFSFSRYPAKYALPFALFWAMLAGFGLDEWRRPWDAPEKRRGMAALAAAAVVAGAAGIGLLWVRRDVQPAMRLLRIPEAFPAEASYLLTRKLERTALVALATAALVAFRRRRDSSREALAVVMGVLLAADMAAAGRGVDPVASPELLEHQPRALDLLGPEMSERRLLAPAADLVWLNAHFVRGVAGWDRRASWALGMQDMLAAPTAQRWGIRGSYDSDVTGLATPALHFLAGALLRNQSTPVATKLLRMGNVGAVVAVQREGFRDLADAGEVTTIFDQPVRVMNVPRPLPPAWVVGGSRAAPSPSAALLVIAETGFDPAAEVVLGPGAPTLPPPLGFRGECAILERRADAIVLEVEESAPGYVVVAEAHQEGWQASVDGAPAPVLPANVLFRAVAVPAGRHHVELRYRPAAAFAGAGLGAAGLVAAAALLRRER